MGLGCRSHREDTGTVEMSPDLERGGGTKETPGFFLPPPSRPESNTARNSLAR